MENLTKDSNQFIQMVIKPVIRSVIQSVIRPANHPHTRISDRSPIYCRSKLFFWVWMVLVCAGLFTSNISRASQVHPYIDIYSGYQSGDFGTWYDTHLFYVTANTGIVSPDYQLSLITPYVVLQNDYNQEHMTNSGLGDIIVRGAAVLIKNKPKGLYLTGALSVKLPVADEQKDLGTGKTDYGAFVTMDYYHKIANLSLSTGYIKIGDPEFVDYNDIYLYGIGLSKSYKKNLFRISIDGSKNTIKGLNDPINLNTGVSHFWTNDFATRAGFNFGLTQTAADFGITLGFTKWF